MLNLWKKLSPTERGNKAESEAQKLLISEGLKPVLRNYHCRSGEIDLIMKDNDTLVFVEVKYRKSINYGDGADSVTYKKQQKLLKAAHHYLLKHPYSGPCRFDVVALSPEHPPKWIKNAFESYE